MRIRSNLVLFLASLSIAGTACVATASHESGADSYALSDATAAGIFEGTPAALGVLKLASEADYDTLRASAKVGLAETTAAHIVAYRKTDADHQFDTLKELDAVPYVGATAFKKLLAYAQAHGYVEETPLVCKPHHFQAAVPASGAAMMAYGGKAYLFADDGVSWTVIENESAVTQPIPLPKGVTQMLYAGSEIGPNGRPLVVFRNGSDDYATFFDGKKFVGTVAIGKPPSTGMDQLPPLVAHADAKERVYAWTSNGLTEFPPGAAPIVRGALPFADPSHALWGVGADGTVYVFNSQPGGGSPGEVDLVVRRLPHGSLTWSADKHVAKNAGYGFAGAQFAAAPDGSLHLAYVVAHAGEYLRSHDGTSWAVEDFMDIVSTATLIEKAAPVFDDDPARVKGQLRLLAAQDYDHASITLRYKGGSLSVPSFYFLRRCAPFQGSNKTWPAERLAHSGDAFDFGAIAVNEVGLVSLLTAFGVRRDVSN